MKYNYDLTERMIAKDVEEYFRNIIVSSTMTDEDKQMALNSDYLVSLVCSLNFSFRLDRLTEKLNTP